MIKEHKWKKIYENSDVEQCEDCPVQRRNGGYSEEYGKRWQYRASASDLGPWVLSDGATAPDCSDAGLSWFKPKDDGTWARTGIQDRDRTTESLETELKELSDRIANDPMRFQQVRDELKWRRVTKDEQPPMQVTTVESQQKADAALSRTLALKVTEMEGQQAKLVVEAEIAKAAQREAEDRLALVVKRLPTKREPMTRDVARELALKNTPSYAEHVIAVNPWIIDAIVEASR